MSETRKDDFINPLDYFDLDVKEDRPPHASTPGKHPTVAQPMRQTQSRRGLFITATDTEVGKTITTAVLGTLFRSRGLDVGVMKPIQCGGADAGRLKKFLQIPDLLNEINPYCAKEPLSPHIAFKRDRVVISIPKIRQLYRQLERRHDIMLVEGAGGLMVPITDDYLMVDLIKDLDLELIIVARLGLGTINHTLLTVERARAKGIAVKGIIFNDAQGQKHGIPEETNPGTIGRLAQVPVLGIIPHLKKISKTAILKECSAHIHVRDILKPGVRLEPNKLQEWDKRYVWHPFTQMQDWLKEEPLIVDEAKGCTLKDISGRKYLDGVSSLWVNVHGHQNKDIDTALKNQISKLSHSTFLGVSNTPAIELAKKLVDLTPAGLEKVFYSDNGSTAVEVAIKMAYQYWQNTGNKNKVRIAHLANAYHGDTLGSVSVGGIDLFHKIFSRLIIKTVAMEFPDFYRCPNGKTYPQYTEECLDKMERLFKQEHNSIAGLIVEPLVQAAAGMIVWPSGILKRISSLCERYQILLIADEVATGFGRTGKMFACEHEGVTPDFLCLAKGLSGGYLPLAATVTTKKVFDGFLFPYRDKKTFFHGHTYTGNPLCCAAAVANLDVFEKNRTLYKLQPMIKMLEEKLKRFADLRHVGDIRQKGFMVGAELVRDKTRKIPYRYEEKIGIRVCQEARKRNVLLRPLGDVIVLMPPLVISRQELEYLLEVAYWAIKKVTDSRPHATSFRPQASRGKRQASSNKAHVKH